MSLQRLPLNDATSRKSVLVKKTDPKAAPALVSPQAKCQQRIKLRMVQEMVLRTQERDDEEAKRFRDREIGERASKMATQRIKERKALKLKKMVEDMDDEVEVLILNQTSSIEAMNVARMLSPRFAEQFSFNPSVSMHSKEEYRVKNLLENDRIGAFYR